MKSTSQEKRKEAPALSLMPSSGHELPPEYAPIAEHTPSPPRTLTPAEKWERATLANGFIFYKVMRHHPNECRELLELLFAAFTAVEP